MIYGMLIGLIISSLVILQHNPAEYSRLSKAGAIALQLTRIIYLTIGMTSTAALIGLLIRGA